MAKFVFDILEVVPGTRADYQQLADYHYRSENIWGATDIFKIKARYPHHNAFPDPIAVIVYRMPLPDLRARTKATNGYFHRPATKSARLKLVNQNIHYIARLIVDPRFRRLGLATKLLTESLAKQVVPIIETITPLDFTNKIFQRAGFELYPTPAPPWYRRFTNMLKSIGFDGWECLLPDTLQQRLERLQLEGYDYIEKDIRAFLTHFRHRRDMTPGLERCKYILSKIPFPEAYLLWFNPRVPLCREIRGDPDRRVEDSSTLLSIEVQNNQKNTPQRG